MPRRSDIERQQREATVQSKQNPASWLVGTWRSNRQLTMEGWGKYPPGSPEFRKLLNEGLGNLVIRYTAKRSYSAMPEHTSVVPYRVVWSSPDSLFLAYGRKGEESGQHIFFRSPEHYFVHVGRYVEHFTKTDA